MKKGEIYEGTVSRILFPNKGEVLADGCAVSVKNALPGQKIRFSVTKIQKTKTAAESRHTGAGIQIAAGVSAAEAVGEKPEIYRKAEGRLLEVLEPAPDECIPVCGQFGSCGGCLYLSLPYERQLQIKEQQVRQILDQAVRGSYVFEGILSSPDIYGYRNKMELSFGNSQKGGALSLGMHRRGSFYDVVTVDKCQIMDEDYRKILQCVLAYFTKKGTPHLHRTEQRGVLRHLLVRKGKKTGGILIDLVTTTQAPVFADADEEQEFVDRLLALSLEGQITGILHTKNDSLADIIQNDGTRILYGKDYFYEELLGLRFRITPFSFFQTNSSGAEVLYEKAREYVGDVKGQTVFDLYSGTGTIAQMLAAAAEKVVGVEIVEEAVTAARENAALNGLKNCEFIAGDVGIVMDGLTEKPDMIVLDPPRDGIHPKALKKIIDYGVSDIVYISCKPTSLARDLAAFQARGYRLIKAAAVDMFPWTGNVETVCLLGNHRLPKPDATVKIGIDMEDYYRIRDNAENKEKPE
ncbi:MAG: 23S rRNA (uracil(1939)-C(5))-methyltransferase RlmD [Clostridiales bacterium]|nr:23S rRNA (uracil(1939)-C(5))-methyltransferase RlmD [Clostridiales bacterium]